MSLTTCFTIVCRMTKVRVAVSADVGMNGCAGVGIVCCSLVASRSLKNPSQSSVAPSD